MTNNRNELQENVKETIKEGYQAVEQGGKDWLNYIITHPLQSLAFGAIGCLALKGLIKK